MSIKADYDALFAKKTAILDQARDRAALTIPTVLLELGQTQQDPLLFPYQNIGSDGVMNMTSQLLMALFPPAPWFRFIPTAVVRANENISDDEYAAYEQWLYMREILAQSQIDAHNHRVKQRAALEHILIIGDSLTMMLKDYRLKNFPAENWVQKKNSAGDVIRIITCEDLSPEMLSDEELKKAKITRDDVLEATVDGTKKPKEFKLYTRVLKDGDGVVWEQEINDTIITPKPVREKVSPYFSVGYEEIAGQDYSRSFVEMKMGDLRSLNGLSKSILDGMVAMSKLLIVVDESGGMQRTDLMSENGAIVSGRVRGGVPEGVGFLTTQKHADFSVAASHAGTIEKRLGKSMMIESVMQPQGDRVTATQVMRLAREVQTVLGSTFPPLAQSMQEPYIKRLIYQMEKDRLLLPLPSGLSEDMVEITILTGMEALSRQSDLDSLMASLETLSQVSPEAMARIRPEVLVDRIMQGFGVDTKGLLMTDEEYDEEKRKALEEALAAQAGQQAIATAGAVAQQQAPQAA